MTGFEVVVFSIIVIWVAVSLHHKTEDSRMDGKLAHRAAYLTGKNIGQAFTVGTRKKHLRRVK